MLARVITSRFEPVTGRFDDKPQLNFLKDKEILSIRGHFSSRMSCRIWLCWSRIVPQPDVTPHQSNASNWP